MEYHDIQTSVLLDGRAEPCLDVGMDEIFYVVHRVVIGNTKWYHHGCIIAGDIEMLRAGINKMQGQILEDIGGAKAGLTPIFIRNLMATDKEVVEVATKQEILSEIAAMRELELEADFVVYGLVGEDQLMLLKVFAPDAISAAAGVIDSVDAHDGKIFLPLEVSFAHPIADELEQFFIKTSADIKTMIGGSPVAIH